MTKIVFLFFLIAFTACTPVKENTSKEIKAYYEGYKNSDYNQVKRTLADSLITTEGDYIMAFSRESYHEQFKWDSVFKPVYKLISIENQEEHPVATITVHSSKFEFLKNNPLKLRHQFYFTKGKISKIKTVDFIDVNWDTWEKEKVALVNWVQTNHPELDGFMNDLTMKGAQNYLKAIDLYQQRQTKVTE
ncbi:hypothetical protein [Maribacter sp. 2308TA10-17]|uniref:hypothetical protein n=1 Tax=Maribacter sp. 2308TA10-17 TaxID=3386276 RepID=UPI0039BCB9F1